MDATRLNEELRSLVADWCDRRELRGLAGLLPAMLANNGLTDGWAELASALRSVAGERHLPATERDQLKRLYVEVDSTIRNRTP